MVAKGAGSRGGWEGDFLDRSVRDADTWLCAVLSHQFAPVFVELAQQLSDGKLKFIRSEGVLLRVDIARNQRGSVLQCLNESCVIDLCHTNSSPIESRMREERQ